MEHVLAEVILSYIKYNHLALEVKTFFVNSTHATGPSTKSSPQKPRLPTDSRHRHHRKREKEKPTHKILQSKG
jgi:hypothetical protein